MLKRVFIACLLQAAVSGAAHAAGPFGTIHVGGWIGGAFSDDSTGSFSHCAATSTHASGISLVVGINTANSWLLSFASPAFRFSKGESLPIDVTFDGQSQARLFATANSQIMVTAILPPNVARDFRKSTLMVAVARDTPLQFNLTSTGPLLTTLANCASKVRADGLNSAAVQPGNSGGPLLDTSGQVVGMVAAKLNALKIRQGDRQHSRKHQLRHQDRRDPRFSR